MYGQLVDSLSPTIHRDTITTPILEANLPSFRKYVNLYPYVLPPILLNQCRNFGINASDQSYQLHSHPFHKTLENHLLYEHWLPKASTRSTVHYMKPAKFQKLHEINANFCTLTNYRNHVADNLRYPEGSPTYPNTPNLFIHDALHYMTPGQIIDLFEHCPNLERVYASAVIPAETYYRLESLNPEAYTLKYEEENLHYFLEKTSSAAYVQPISAVDWLRYRTISNGLTTLSVCVLETWGPAHSILISRGHPDRGKTRRFYAPKAVLLPNPLNAELPINDRLVPKSVYEGLFIYTRAVRTLRVTDPQGYIRTQSAKEEHSWVSASAWDQLATFSLQTVEHRPPSIFGRHESRWQAIVYWWSTNSHIWKAQISAFVISAPLLARFLNPIYLSISAKLFGKSICGAKSILVPGLAAAPPLSFAEEWAYVHFPTPPSVVHPWLAKILEPILRIYAKANPSACWKEVPIQDHFSLTFECSRHNTLKRMKEFSIKSPWMWFAVAAAVFYFWKKLTLPASTQKQSDNYLEFHQLKTWHLELPTFDWLGNAKPYFNQPGAHPKPSGPSSDPPVVVHHDNTASFVDPPRPRQCDCPTTKATPPPEGNGDAPELSGDGPNVASPLPLQSSQPGDADSQTSSESTTGPNPTPTVVGATERAGGASTGAGPELPAGPETQLNPPTLVDPREKPTGCEPICCPQQAVLGGDVHDDACASGPSVQQPNLLLRANDRSMHPKGNNGLTERGRRTGALEITTLNNDPTADGEPMPFTAIWTTDDVPDVEGAWLTRKRLTPAKHPVPKSNICLLHAFNSATGITIEKLWEQMCAFFPDSQLVGEEEIKYGYSESHLVYLAWANKIRARVISSLMSFQVGPKHGKPITIYFEQRSEGGHWTLQPPAPMRGAKAPKWSVCDFSKIAQEFKDQSGHLLPFLQVHTHKVDQLRAKNLSSNMKNGYDGLMHSTQLSNPNFPPDFLRSLDNRVDFSKGRDPVKLIHLSGFAGCGKSYPVSQMLLTTRMRNCFKVIVPTVNLRDEWRSLLKIEREPFRIATWESGLVKDSARVLVIDEIYKMPNGYLDLALIALPSVEFVILLGDPCQAAYCSTNEDSTNKKLRSEIHHLRKYRDIYCHWTHRLPQSVAALLGVPTSSKEIGRIRCKATASRHKLTLVPAHVTANTMNKAGIPSITYASSQGMTIKSNAQVYIDRNSTMVHKGTILVALTRSKTGIEFVGDHFLIQERMVHQPLLDAVYFNRPVVAINYFDAELSGTKILDRPMTERLRPIMRGGADWRQNQAGPIRPSFESAMKRYHRVTNFKFDPAHPRKPRPANAKPLPPTFQDDVMVTAPEVFHLGPDQIPRVSTHFLPETRRPLHQDLPSAVPSDAKPQSCAHSTTPIEPVYPGFDYQLALQHLVPLEDPEDKEIYFKNERSNQFPHLNKDFEFGTQNPGLVAPKHSSKDDPTLLMASIAKRLRFRPTPYQYHISPKDTLLGSLLFSSHCRAYHRNPNQKVAFDENVFADCISLNEWNQLSSKTQSVIMANHDRSNPDWRLSAVRIFSKTQHKINENTIFSGWKACQTLALMHDAVVLIFGPVKKYQRLHDQKERPKNLFVYGGQTPFDLSNAAKRLIKDHGTKVCNDYSSFDQSQHGEAVVLEVLKMRRLNIPERIIDLHVEIKTSITCQFGPLTCMRLTGEPGTYDDNTDYNIAVLYSEYDIQDEGVFVSGDDSLISRVPKPHEDWEAVSPLLHLQFKKEYVNHGIFCGYYLGKEGAIRAPRPLFAKIAVALADDSMDDKLASYLSEFTVGHSLGDEFWNLLPQDQVIYQCALFDFFCRNASKEQKISLKIGEVPEETCRTLFAQGVKYLTRPMFALLDRAMRLRVLHQNPDLRAPLTEPELEGVLLPHLPSECPSYE
ncbi:RNA-dependent RNA polymerase [Erysiphe necator associated tymo-like virus 1]|nr:RNA-dependent RNA polymerase [Erysiphe necator associated tymo-like virus 1]